jgi:transcriptional regulator with XRE-family HTH domain
MSAAPRTNRTRSDRTENLQKIMDQRGFTRRQVAKILKVNIGTVAKWLLPMDSQGHRDPPFSVILALRWSREVGLGKSILEPPIDDS